MSSLSITTIQTALHWEDKTANLLAFEKKLQALDAGAELVILPEMFSTGFSMQPQKLAETMEGPTVKWMAEQAAKHRIVLTGSLIIEENQQYYNRLIWMMPNGQYGYYDKRHLFAFAGEHEHYSPGQKRLIASLKGWRIHVQICYDLRFPVWARQQIKHGENPAPEYDVLLYVANWPQRRSLAWKTLLQARAIENQCFCVGVNRVGNDGHGIYHSGDSMVVNPLGEVLYQRADDEDINRVVLQKAALHEVRDRFPFWKDGDFFTIH
jgi:predicted amidohydrolase